MLFIKSFFQWLVIWMRSVWGELKLSLVFLLAYKNSLFCNLNTKKMVFYWKSKVFCRFDFWNLLRLSWRVLVCLGQSSESSSIFHHCLDDLPNSRGCCFRTFFLNVWPCNGKFKEFCYVSLEKPFPFEKTLFQFRPPTDIANRCPITVTQEQLYSVEVWSIVYFFVKNMNL